MYLINSTKMTNQELKLPGGGKAVVFPEEVVVYNFTEGDSSALGDFLATHSVVPVTFLATKFDPAVFSQAETRNRSFIFAEKFISRADVNPEYPVQWLAEGNLFPMDAGGLEVLATPTGFQVQSVTF